MTEPKTHKRKVAIRAHTYVHEFPDGGITVNMAQFGEEIEVSDVELERGERLGAFVTAEDEANAAAAEAGAEEVGDGDQPEVDLMGDDELVSFVESHTAAEVVDAAGDNAEFAQRLLTAEGASSGDARKSVVEPLQSIIEKATV